jgi:ribonuclease HI
MSKKLSYYAIAKGHTSNIIVNTWDECKQLVHGYKGATYKKHISEAEANEYLKNISAEQITYAEIEGGGSLIRRKRNITSNTEVIIIYTDGSLIRKGGNVYAGYGIYIPSKNFEYSSKLDGKKTNNRAELKAIISSVQMYNESDDILLKIYTDSSYSIKIFGETGLNYRNNDYKKKSKEVPNADLVRIATDLADKYILEFTHINSHTSNTDEHSMGNDRADKLAVRGAVKDYLNSANNIGEFMLTFGKYKNNNLSIIPKSYLKWLAESESFEELCKKKEEYRLEKEIVIHYLTKKI